MARGPLHYIILYTYSLLSLDRGWGPQSVHAYALTAHRSQGSEEEHAIAVVDMYEQFQSRESLYTIASRGKASTAIFGEARKLYAALHRTSRDQRQTMLAQRLMCACWRVGSRPCHVSLGVTRQLA